MPRFYGSTPGVGSSVFSKSAGKDLPLIHAKAKPGEKPGLAAPVRMGRRQQIFDNFPSFDTSLSSIWQFHAAQSSDLEVCPLVGHLPACK